MMTEDHTSTAPLDTREAQRLARAHRILDAAATLILRWGYNKTTVDDIARQADVAKGTIYLHWNTRDALFTALMQRERLALVEDVYQRITDDPDGASLYAILRHSALALMQRPLLRAALLRDTDVIGRLVARPDNQAILSRRITGFAAYLEVLRAHGIVRADRSIHEQIYVVSAVLVGFFFAVPLLPEHARLSDDVLADLLAETVQRALEPDATPGSAARSAASTALQQYLARGMALAQEQFQHALSNKPPQRSTNDEP